MTTRLNLIGERFTCLLVVDRVPLTYKKNTWYCICDCGNLILVRRKVLLSGKIKSCGCSRKQLISKANFQFGCNVHPKEYKAWSNMKTRCYYKKSKDYKDYGGRGIKVCKRWLNSFPNFFSDMGVRPSSNHSLDRINTNGIYKPSNCRWATDEQQLRNYRKNRWIRHNGLNMILADWAKYLGVSHSNLTTALKRKNIGQIYSFYLNKHGKLPFKTK